ncbi:MAG: response regulator [bacterium]|nr:response regulator [bacterium]
MPITFLYAEDDPMSRQVMHVMLTKLELEGGAEVTIFEDSSNFMERVKALPKVPDVILLDVQITPHTGFEMLKMLRADSAYDGKPIIAMTASVTVSDIEDLKKAGFDGLIAKPVRKKVFPELLERILAGDAVWYVP